MLLIELLWVNKILKETKFKHLPNSMIYTLLIYQEQLTRHNSFRTKT